MPLTTDALKLLPRVGPERTHQPLAEAVPLLLKVGLLAPPSGRVCHPPRGSRAPCALSLATAAAPKVWLGCGRRHIARGAIRYLRWRLQIADRARGDAATAGFESAAALAR